MEGLTGKSGFFCGVILSEQSESKDLGTDYTANVAVSA